MKRTIFFQILISFIFIFPVYGQNDSIENPYDAVDTLQEGFDLFKNHELLNITLRFNITEYKRKKPKEDYLKALLTYHFGNKDSINKEIRLKSGGDFRNSYCYFPPIRLNFRKPESEIDSKKIGNIKMVTHCKSGSEVYLFKEYLIYKLYNILTDNSFKVRLVKINYINTYKKEKPIDTYAFLIEPVELMAERIGGHPVTLTKLSPGFIIPEMLDRMAIFNYMIGNTDWLVNNQHNCKAISQLNSPNPSLAAIVPNDFDYAGLVNTSYAIPDPNLGIQTVRDRIYMGLCRSEDVFLKELKEFTDKKDEFYKLINEFPYLNEKEKKNMIDFLDQFYSEFDKHNTIIYSLLKNCKN